MTNHEEEIKRMQGVIADTEKELKEFDEMMGEVEASRVIRFFITEKQLWVEKASLYSKEVHRDFIEICNEVNIEVLYEDLDDYPEDCYYLGGSKSSYFSLLAKLSLNYDIELI